MGILGGVAGLAGPELFGVGDERIQGREIGQLLREVRDTPAVEQLTFARGLVEGTTDIGGFDIDNLTRNVITPESFQRLQQVNPELAAKLDAGQGGTLEELVSVGQKANVFTDNFRNSLINAGVFTGSREAGGVQFSPENLKQLRQGFFPQAKQFREAFGDIALRALGVPQGQQRGLRVPSGAGRHLMEHSLKLIQVME